MLIAPGLDADTPEDRLLQGWDFATRKSEELDPELREALAQGEVPEQGEEEPRELVVAAVTSQRQVRMHAASQPFETADGETVVVFAADAGDTAEVAGERKSEG